MGCWILDTRPGGGNGVCAAALPRSRRGVDKRCIAAGGASIEKELARLAPVVKDGGYIPGCDHGVPPDIAWPDFLRYGKLLAELTGW